jgi:hypothetical protein
MTEKATDVSNPVYNAELDANRECSRFGGIATKVRSEKKKKELS